MKSLESPQSSLKTGLSLQAQQETVLALLTGGKEGKLDHNVMYNRYNELTGENGVQAFRDFSQTPMYHEDIVEPERRLIQQYAPQLRKQLGNKFRDIVELGPGNEKFQYFMRALGYSAQEKDTFRYLPSDGSQIATSAGKEDAQAVGVTCGNAINEDRATADFSHVQDALYLCFGGGLWNNDVSKIVRNLQSGNMVRGGKLLTTCFVLPDPDAPDYADQVYRIKAIYGDNDPANPYRSEISYRASKKMILKPFVALGFPEENLDLAVIWHDSTDGKSAGVTLGARVVESFQKTLGDRILHQEAGTVMGLIETPRKTSQQVASELRRGGANDPQILGDGQVRLAVARLPRKPVPAWMKKTAIYASTILTLLAGGTKLGTYIQKEQMQTKQQKIFEETFYHEQRTTKELEGVLTKNETEARKIIYLLEYRYANQLNDQQKEIIEAMFYDWIKMHPEYMQQKLFPGQMYYSTDSYLPSMESTFVREHKNQLTALGCITTPNASLLYYHEALFNTYTYEGEQLEFAEVEQELPNYERESISSRYNSDTKEESLDHFSYATGIVHIGGKPYMVFKWMKDRGFLLQKKDPQLRDFGTSTDVFAIDIIQQGQVPLLAQKIRLHINKQFGTGYDGFLNGQDIIAKYLTDLYAQGYDLSYLLTGEEAEHRWESKPSMLESFVVGFALPDLYDALTNGSESMHDLDIQKLCKRIDEIGNLHIPLQDLNSFLHRYLPDKYVDAHQTQSKLLQLFLADRAWTFLEDDWDRRCRLAEHSTELGLPELAFPQDLENYITNGKYDPKSTMKDLSIGDISDYSMIPFTGGYRTISGEVIDLGQYSANGRTNHTLVGRKADQGVKEQIRNDYLTGKLPKVYQAIGHGASYEIKEKSQVIAHYLDKIPFSSTPVHELMQDYAEWKARQKIYEAKKNGEYKKA